MSSHPSVATTSPYRGSEAEPFKLQYRADGTSLQTFTLTTTQLVHEWTSNGDTGRREYPFEQLEAEVAEIAGRGNRPAGALERAFFFGGLAVVFTFSTLRTDLPLLPYFLGMVSFYYFQRHFAVVGKRVAYLVIMRKGVEAPLYIDRSRCDAAKVETFKELFTQRVRNAKGALVSA